MKNKFTYVTLGILTCALGFLVFQNIQSTKTEKESFVGENESEESGESIMGAINHFHNLRANQITGEIDSKDIYSAIDQADKLAAKYKANAANLVWTEMGPSNVGGRTRSLVVDKDSNNILYAGSVGGGVWKSKNKGLTWFKVTPTNVDNFPVVSMTQTPDGAIYFGTGETAFVNAEGTNTGSGFTGSGIWKSTDKGQTWTRLSTTNPSTNSRWQNVTSLANYTYSGVNRIYATTTGGFFYSENGGTSWTNVATLGSGLLMEVKVGKDGRVMVASASRVYISPNGISGFVSKTLTTAGTSRIAIAISDQDPDYMYAMSARSSDEQLEGVYRSTDGGNAWTRLGANSPELNILASQGRYDNVIAVDPEDKDHIFCGGLGNWDWTLGKGWKQISSQSEFFQDKTYNTSYVHADMHGYIFDLSTKPYSMYLVNDGGVFRTTNKGKSYEKLNNQYAVTQLYSVAVNTRGEILSGSQDNGTNLIDFRRNSIDSRASVEALGGDGFFCEFSQIYPDICYAANVSQYFFFRSLNKGQSWSEYFDANIGTRGENLGVSFLTPYKLWETISDPNISDTVKAGKMFYGGANGSVWMTPDALNFARAPKFFKLAQVNSGGQILALDFTRTGNTLFVGSYSGQLFRITNIRGTDYNPDSAAGWKASNHGIVVEQINVPFNGRAITSIAIHKSDSNKVVVTCGNYGNNDYVFTSNNAMGPAASVSFSSAQGNLPKMPVYSSTISNYNSNLIIVGSELGVWSSEDGGSSWTEQNQGLSRTPCYMLRQYDTKPWEGPTVYAATHGRGVFRTKSLVTGIKPIVSNKTISNIYPNPASDQTNIAFTLNNSGNATVNIFDMNGRLALTKTLPNLPKGNNTTNLNLESLPAGNYIVKIQAINELSTGRLIIVK